MEVPSAIYVVCPECADETLHSVLKGTVGTKKGFTLNATVRCETCSRVHHVVVKEAKDIDIPVILSQGNTSRKTTTSIAGDETVTVGETLIVDGINCRITGLETKDAKRVERAPATNLLTIWVKDFETIKVKFTINLGKKTISKAIDMTPTDLVAVGQEYTFNRLRVTVHGIKVERRMLRRGDAEAQEIARVFAKPTRLDFEGRVFDSAREGARIARAQREQQRALTDEEVLQELPDWEEDEDNDAKEPPADQADEFEDVAERPARLEPRERKARR